MSDKQKALSVFKDLFKNYDSDQQVEIAAQLFLEYCVYQEQCENRKKMILI